MGWCEIFLGVETENREVGSEKAKGLLVGAKVLEERDGTVFWIREREEIDKVARKGGSFRDLDV